jgi:hypothetical protein
MAHLVPSALMARRAMGTPLKMGSTAQWKPATSADPLFGRPPNVDLDFPENLAETTHSWRR